MIALLTILATAALAFANGANDVSKGVATLAGSGRATYRRAIAWPTLWTAVGAVAALAISMGLVKAFTSSLVMAASLYALPVSTTHVATGAIVGAGVRQGGGAVAWNTVGAFVLAWVVTLPLAAAFGGLTAWTVSAVIGS